MSLTDATANEACEPAMLDQVAVDFLPFPVRARTLLVIRYGLVAALFGLLLVLPLLAQALLQSLQQHVNRYLPLLAGTAGMTTQHGTDQLTPWAGLGVFAIYVVVALGIGLYVLRRRDA